MDALETEVYKGCTIEIHADQDAESPRENDNAGTMVCFWSGSDLGDKNDFQDPEAFEDWAKEPEQKGLLILPIYVYEHGGITIQTGTFSDPWDSGRAGWVYMTRAKAIEEWAGKGKRFTAAVQKRALACMESEVKVYANWLEGGFRGFIAKDADGEEIDSCWGFDDEKYCMEEAKSNVDYHVKEQQRAKRKARAEERLNVAWEHRYMAI